MSAEKCPLSGGAMAVESLPPFCRKNCAHLWEIAIKEQMSVIDSYPDGNVDESEACNHELYEVVHSHEGLQPVDDSQKRIYSLVDMCEGCTTELQDSSYTFECPNN